MRLGLLVLLPACSLMNANVAGTYTGNESFVRSDGATGAGSAVIVITEDQSSGDATVLVDDGCTLSASPTTSFSFAYTIAPQELCTVSAAGAFGVAAGSFLVSESTLLTLNMGGYVIGGAGVYVTYQFQGTVQ